MHRAALLCGCRRARGDPDDSQCDRLYPGIPSVPADQPPPEKDPSQVSPRSARPMESGS
jgi:hypothetical protein